jgi:hypothetical protein
MNNLLIYLLLVLLLFLLIQKRNDVVESFQYNLTNEKILKRKLKFESMPVVNIYKNSNVESNELKKIDKYLNNITVATENNIENIKNKEHALYYTDAYTYSKYYKNYKLLTMCSIPKQLLFVSNRGLDLINSTLNVGYLNDVDLELFKIIIKSQINYTNLNNYNFVKLERNEIITRLFGTETEEPNIDLFIYFNTILNPMLDELVKQNKFNLVSYDYKITNLDMTTNENDEDKIVGGDAEYSLDENLLKFYLPYSKKYIQTISKNSDDNSSSDNNNIIYNTILIDTLLLSFNDDTGDMNTYMNMNTSKFNEIYLYILNYYNEFLKINFYMQHFKFLNLSKEWALDKQKNGSFKNVMEPFDDKFLKFKINQKYLIPYDKTDSVIKYKFNKLKISDIPLKKDDELYSEHKGVTQNYKVISIDDKYAYLEQVIEKLDEGEFEPLYRCYQDNTILTKGECIDTIDKVGNPKPSYNWDRPCKTNTECPFFLSNKNYPNERGGCINGYCELPIGIKRKSYRDYDKTITESNYPRCDGCDINNGKECCEKQKTNPKYNSPDYKFENDIEDRRLSKFF